MQIYCRLFLFSCLSYSAYGHANLVTLRTWRKANFNKKGEDKMSLLEETIEKIETLDQMKMEEARTRLDNLVKPPKSLGRLEDMAVQLAGITKTIYPALSNKTMIVMAADHGVYEEGVSSNPQNVTYIQTPLFPRGLTGVCAISKVSGAKVVTVDIGVKGALPSDTGVIDQKIKQGTDNIAKGPAMTRDEAIKSIEVGIQIANEEMKNGAQLLGIGEMGIGNTTPSTAILSVLAGVDSTDITGIGAGIGDGGIDHKSKIIEEAIKLNQPDSEDGIDILSKVGGLEIGGMAGVILAAAANRTPVVVDGYISTAAALIAAVIEPKTKEFMITSHVSLEPGAKKASELLGINPLMEMNMRLGEGSGAALVFPIIESASSIIKNMATFDEVGMKI
jgi:nicotinate-nucleotide--dimethylbenzimidazole phosphoribosyltransferase